MNGRSGESERVLFLSPEPPYPLTGGGPLRSASLLHYLAQHRPTHLIAFAPEDEPSPECALPKGLVERISIVRLPVHGKDAVSRMCRNTGRLLRGRLPLMDRFAQPGSLRRVDAITRGMRYSMAVVEHFWCADYLRLLRDRARYVVLDLHNIESALHEGCARTESWPANLGHRFFGKRAYLLERRLLAEFDLVLTASEADADRVRAIAPEANVAVFPNAIPLRDVLDEPEEPVLAFSGNLEYHPNVTAVRYFATRVWPILREKHPGLVWRLIGKNAHAVREFVAGDARVEVTGPVPDALPELARASVAIAPLLAGSGTRIKIMEAWAAARPVVSTRIGAEGLPAVDRENLLFAETPEQWVRTVSELLADEGRRRRLGAAGRAVFEAALCWPAAWRRLDEQGLGRILESLPAPRTLAAAG